MESRSRPVERLDKRGRVHQDNVNDLVSIQGEGVHQDNVNDLVSIQGGGGGGGVHQDNVTDLVSFQGGGGTPRQR